MIAALCFAALILAGVFLTGVAVGSIATVMAQGDPEWWDVLLEGEAREPRALPPRPARERPSFLRRGLRRSR